jgi:putative membrane protein
MTAKDARHTMGALLAATVVLAACSKSDHNAATPDTAMGQPMAGTSTGATSSTTTTTTPAGSTATAPTADTTHLSDANILAKEEGGDSSEVAIATYVRSHAASAGVKSYAGMLVDDHGKALRQVKSTASTLKITPQVPPNDTTAQKTAHTMATLQSLHGAALDSTFVNDEIMDHQHDIAEAHEMANSAQNAQVKSLVQSSIPVLQKHLDRAQQLAKQK